jgi:hypothetical protein
VQRNGEHNGLSQLKPHPLAKLFPKYGEEELLDLASDIAANGQMQQCRHTRRAGATPMATSNRLAKLAKSSESDCPILRPSGKCRATRKRLIARIRCRGGRRQ